MNKTTTNSSFLNMVPEERNGEDAGSYMHNQGSNRNSKLSH